MSFFLPLIEALNREKVSYVVVGGLAVVLHGHGRLTVDLDIVVRLDAENALKTVELLTSRGFAPRAPVDPKLFADAEARRSWIAEKGLKVFTFFDKAHPFFSVDLFVDYPVDFEGLFARSIVKSVGSELVRIAGMDDLIAMKRRAGRPQDLEDIKVLEALRDAGLA